MDVEGSMLKAGTKLSDGQQAQTRRKGSVMGALSTVNYFLGIVAFIGVLHLEMSQSASPQPAANPAPAALVSEQTSTGKSGHTSAPETTTTAAATTITTTTTPEHCPVTPELCGASITSDLIANGNVTSSKLAPSAVTAAKLAAGAVTSSKLAADSVTSAALDSSAVTSSKIMINAVDSSKIQDGEVHAADIANGAVATSALAGAAVTTAKLAGGSVTGAKLADAAVTADKLSGHSVTSGKIAPKAVGAPALDDEAVTVDKLAEGSVDGSKVQDGSLSAADMDSDSVQLRVTGSCATGIVSVGSDGSATCMPKTIKGVVDGAHGAIAISDSEAGFSSHRTGTGKYTVSFTSAFASKPVVILSSMGLGICFTPESHQDLDGFSVYCKSDVSSGSWEYSDMPFSFSASPVM